MNPVNSAKKDFRLVISSSGGAPRVHPLGAAGVSVGRAAGSDLAFPDDSGLSRRHLAFEPSGTGWAVRDLGSKNGTFVNSERIGEVRVLSNGDLITAGHLSIEFRDGTPIEGPVSFVEPSEASIPFTGAVVTTVGSLSRPLQAVIRAGQELAGDRPLADLFPLILDLALEAVGASRGVLMTLEGGELVTRAFRGAGFRISRAVRDRILVDRDSVLVRDAQFDAAFRERQSIVEQQVRSMMAVPLETRGLVIGLIYVDLPNIIHPFTKEDLDLLTVMANVAAARIEQARMAEVEAAERVMARELAQAAEIQKNLLPAAAPVVPDFELAGQTEACRTVGGDYFDFIPYPDGRLAVLVGDVAGKGMSAALLMSSLQARVQVLAESGGDPARVVARLNRSLIANCPGNRFITFFYAVLNPATGELQYSNAGHNPPLVIRADGRVELLEDGGTVLGVFPDADYAQGSVRLGGGDVVTLYSDGVTETCPPDSDDEFGTERLARFLQEHASETASRAVATAMVCVSEYAGGLAPADDATLVLIRRTAS